MTDWLRVLGYSILGFVILIGVGWESWILYHRRQFRVSERERQAIQDSQRGRRPLWRVEESGKERER